MKFGVFVHVGATSGSAIVLRRGSTRRRFAEQIMPKLA
jgi:hypothetical protein